MMASAQVVETSVNTNNSPPQDYTTNTEDHSKPQHWLTWLQTFHCYMRMTLAYLSVTPTKNKNYKKKDAAPKH